jgi:ribA/ribD-fused uncharacterized protein
MRNRSASLISEGAEKEPFRQYLRSEAAVFLKTKEKFGGLSNMAGGFPVRVNGRLIPTVEAFYQACRFPHLPEVQFAIISEASPMTAKMKGKPFRSQSRADWNCVRIPIMRWSLRLKLAFHFKEFSTLLLSTGNLPIVEESRRDAFWGAQPHEVDFLTGENVLGRLLMELREEVRCRPEESFRSLKSLNIPDFLLLSEPIEPIVTYKAR